MLTEERKAEIEKQRLEAHEKAKENLAKYWNSLKPFKEVNDIPTLPRAEDKEWQNFYVPRLIKAGAIPKSELVDGEYYIGNHRNATVARWNAKDCCFDFMRRKFTYLFPETVEHFEDNSRFDLFVPIKKGTEEQWKENKE